MGHRPKLHDLAAAFGCSLWRLLLNERLRALGRLALLAALIGGVGALGPWVMRRLPPPIIEVNDVANRCRYVAQLAGEPALVSTDDSHSQITWFIRNIGTCPWTSAVTLEHVYGPIIETESVIRPVDFLLRTEEGDLIVTADGVIAPSLVLTTPLPLGVNTVAWRLFTPQHEPFGPLLTYTIQVSADQPPTPTVPPAEWVDVWFMAPAVLGVVFALLRSGAFVAGMYSLHSLSNGLRFALATVLGIPNGTVIVVRRGEIEGAPPPRPLATARSSAVLQQTASPAPSNEVALNIGGPGLLDVRLNTAVVTERGGGFARMLGAGEHSLRAFERPRAVIDLNNLSQSSDEIALTKDGIPVKVSVGTKIRMMAKMPNEERPAPPKPGFLTVLRQWLRPQSAAHSPEDSLHASPEALRLATYEVSANALFRPTWHGAAHLMVTGEVRDAMSSRLLDQLFAPDSRDSVPRREISRLLADNGKATLARRGIELLDSGFGNIQVPDEVTEQRRKNWETWWEKETAITQSRGEAEAILHYQKALAEAQVEFIQSILQAVRTNSQTHEANENAHPLSLRFMDDIARVVDRALRAVSNRMISEREFRQLLQEIRRGIEETRGSN